MGTRADFYVGKGEKAEWIGSTAWDGYRDGIGLTLSTKELLVKGVSPDSPYAAAMVNKHRSFPKGKHLFDSKTEKQFRDRVAQYFANRDDVTLPEMGWPWPWDDSGTTDCSYWFFGGRVWDVHHRGSGTNTHVWVPCDEPEPSYENEQKRDKVLRRGQLVTFPNMKLRKKVTLGRRSGLIVMGIA